MLRGMWDLPGPGVEPVSPALAGGFLTTAPPGKSHLCILFLWGGGGAPHCAARRILVPRPGIEPLPPAVEVQSLSRWTAREVPLCILF